MKISYLYKIVVSLSLVTFCLTACIKEDLGQGIDTDPDEEVEITFQYHVSEMSVPETRGEWMSETQMNAVSDARSIHVLVYKIKDNREETFAYCKGAFDHSHTGKSGTFRVRLAKSEAGEKYSMDFLFNINSTMIINLMNNIEIGENRETVRQNVVYNNSFIMSSSSYFPMWAGLEAMVIGKDTSFPILTLIRSFARIDVGLNLDDNDVAHGTDNFVLTYAAYACQSSRALFIPDRNNINGDKVIAPSFPASYSVNSSVVSSHSGITDNKIIAGLFPFESDGEVQSGTRYFSVIVGGNYTDESGNTSLQYYRIALPDPEDPGKRIKLLRNHKYRLNILSIDGPGYNTAATAMNNPPINITTQLTVHEQGNINYISYNNNYYLGVNTILMEYPSTAQSAQEIKVKTNMTGGWGILSILDESGNTPDWITFTTSTGAINTLGTARFNLTANNSGNPRAAIVKIGTSNGSLSMDVTIQQSN